MDDRESVLRRLAIRDDDFIERLLADRRTNIEASGLDPRTHAFVRLGALIALDAPAAAYHESVEAALAAGASLDEVVGALVAVICTTGVARATSAAPRLGLAIGYDVEAALEA